MVFCDVKQKCTIVLQETVASSSIHRRQNLKFTATGCVYALCLQKGKIFIKNLRTDLNIGNPVIYGTLQACF